MSARLLTHDEVSALPNMDKPWGIHRDEHGTYALTFDELRARLNAAAPNLRDTALDLFAQLAAAHARIADLERLAAGPRTPAVDDGLARPFAPETLPAGEVK